MLSLEAVVQRCSVKKVFLEISKNPQENTCAQNLYFNKFAGLRPATLLKTRLWHRCCPENFAKFLRTPFFIEHFWWRAASSAPCPTIPDGSDLLLFSMKHSYLLLLTAKSHLTLMVLPNFYMFCKTYAILYDLTVFISFFCKKIVIYINQRYCNFLFLNFPASKCS